MDTSKIVNNSGKLRFVSAYCFEELPKEIAALKLEFEHATFSVEVIEDTDEILLGQRTEFEELDSYQEHVELMKGIGQSVSWCWLLNNNQGYTDGLRLEFANGFIIEFIVVCSSLKQFTVKNV